MHDDQSKPVLMICNFSNLDHATLGKKVYVLLYIFIYDWIQTIAYVWIQILALHKRIQ